MATAVGLQTVFGTSAKETTYGTAAAIDRWYEIVSEGLQRRQTVLQSSGIRAGTRNLRRGSRRALVTNSGEGPTVLEVANKGFGRLFEVMLGGTPSITQPDATNSPTVYEHTYSLGSITGKSLTLQKGLRDQAGTTVEKFTYHGAKVASWELAIGNGEIARLTINWDCEEVETTTALAAHSYTTASVFHFAQASLKKGGANVAKVLNCSISGDNALKTDSFFLGTSGKKGEPEPEDFPTVTGQLEAEFDSPATFYDVFTADTGVELKLLFEGATIEDTFKYALEVTIPEAHFTGETPTVDGPGVVTQTVPFEGADDGTNAGISFLYRTTDSAA